MLTTLDLVEVREGATTFWVPRSGHTKGPKAKEGRPFYNPAMRLARDVSVLVGREIVRGRTTPLNVCDAMASLGARGLRIAHEVPRVHVVINDQREDSAALAGHNADRLGLTNVEVRHGRLETLLAERRFDWVDLDPFGSPAPFLDDAVGAIADGGVWAVTATDKAALCGVYEDVCRERYGAKPLHGAIMWEVATRILMGALARTAQRCVRHIEPLLSHSTNHYVRVYARVRDGAKDPPLGYAWVKESLERGVSPRAPPGAEWAGPLWTGALSEPTLARRLAESVPPEFPDDTRRRLQLLAGEAEAPPLYFTIDEFTRRLKVNGPRLDRLVQKLKEEGHRAARTHFTPRAFKTDAKIEEIERAIGGAGEM